VYVSARDMQKMESLVSRLLTLSGVMQVSHITVSEAVMGCVPAFSDMLRNRHKIEGSQLEVDITAMSRGLVSGSRNESNDLLKVIKYNTDESQWMTDFLDAMKLDHSYKILRKAYKELRKMELRSGSSGAFPALYRRAMAEVIKSIVIKSDRYDNMDYESFLVMVRRGLDELE